MKKGEVQIIRHVDGYKSIHPLFDELERFYSDLSNVDSKKQLFLQPYDSVFLPILKTFEERTGYKFAPMIFEKRTYEPLKLPMMDAKNIIVCYSGGKDSFAVIRHYQKKGYNVYAYHIRGLNKTYYDEWETAEKMAEELGIPLYIDNVSYSGGHIWIEHPLKNMIMASMALNWGIRNGISTKIACGTFRTARLDDVSFEVCAGDCMDMWEKYEAIVRQVLPSFQMYIPNQNFQTAYNLLIKEPKYLPLTISCLTPNRFRELFRNRTIKNYGIDLMPNRCGCCWKCATEYIWFSDHDILEYNQKYYIHCLEVLMNTLEQETGYSMHSIEYVWDNYFFYSMRKSKAYKELKNAFIRARKIKFATKNPKR